MVTTTNNGLFVGAKFGDKFKTRDGKCVLFIEFCNGLPWVRYEGTDCDVCIDNKGSFYTYEESDNDIIGRWEDTIIDYSKLEELAKDYATNHCDCINDDEWYSVIEGYKRWLHQSKIRR